jgi:hypothetical protein
LGVLVGVLAAAVTALGSILVYLATRRRDVPSLRIEKQKADISDAQVALEAWVEMSAAVGKERDAARARVADLEERLRRCFEAKAIQARLAETLEDELMRARASLRLLGGDPDVGRH